MKKIALLLVLAIHFTFIISCSDDDVAEIADGNSETTEEIDGIDDEVYVEAYADTDFETTDWTDETHSKSADPNYDEVFEDEAVKRIDIVVTEDRWQSMLDDMTDLYGEFGGSGGGPGASGPPNGGPGGGGFTEVDEDPIFVPAEVLYEGKEWYRVGVRFKGNSSLQSSWSSGILKLSFKLDFDEFEDEYPQIDNQRFNGFKKLSLKNNYNDKSMLREKLPLIFSGMQESLVPTPLFILYMLIMVMDQCTLVYILW